MSILLIVTGPSTQEESVECLESQKEENIDGQDNLDKPKGETKAGTEANAEIRKKEVNHCVKCFKHFKNAYFIILFSS